MDNQHQQSFQAVPLLMAPHQTELRDRLRAEVPPRVRVAMEVMHHLTQKTAVVPLPQYGLDNRFEVTSVDGQQLIDEEKDAQRAAMRLLEDYFTGVLKECPWDGVREAQQKKRADPDGWNVINCPSCTAGKFTPRDNCLLCGNSGKVRVARVEE